MGAAIWAAAWAAGPVDVDRAGGKFLERLQGGRASDRERHYQDLASQVHSSPGLHGLLQAPILSLWEFNMHDKWRAKFALEVQVKAVKAKP